MLGSIPSWLLCRLSFRFKLPLGVTCPFFYTTVNTIQVEPVISLSFVHFGISEICVRHLGGRKRERDTSSVSFIGGLS
jgi:hypothetical protein